jgi:Fe-S oxidoreductase
VEIADVFRALRWINWQDRTVEPGLPSMLWSMYWNENPWSQPPSQRFDWAVELGVPIFDPQLHEAVLYIGCTAAYDRRVQRVAIALVNVLTNCGAKFGCLGKAEPCCGEPVKSVGHTPYFEEVARSTAKTFRELGVRKLVTISPHCYDVFKNHYPQILGENFLETVHYTQFLSELIESGLLNFTPELEEGSIEGGNRSHIIEGQKITFQDPCYLGRGNGEFRAPRHVLESIPGTELVEMENHGVDGLCCGGGGGRMWLETPPGERFADVRVQQAAHSGASILATACPFCLVCLEDSLKAAGRLDMRVLDVAEVAWESMRGNLA